jgi:hypothetical protein
LTKKISFGARLLIFAVALVLCCTCASAQVITGTILGSVKDSSGAAVPGAKITITNTQTNVVTHSSSNETGNFTVPLLPSGRYDVAVEA